MFASLGIYSQTLKSRSQNHVSDSLPAARTNTDELRGLKTQCCAVSLLTVMDGANIVKSVREFFGGSLVGLSCQKENLFSAVYKITYC